MYTLEIYQHDEGYGYRILQDGNAIAEQPYAPGLDGNTPMSEAEAQTYGEDHLVRVSQ